MASLRQNPASVMQGRKRRLRLLSFAVLLTVIPVLSSCFIGGWIVDGIHGKQDKLAEAVRPMSRGAVEEMGRAFEDSVQPRLVTAVGAVSDELRPQLDTMVTVALDSLETRVNRLEDSLTALISERANEALQTLIAENSTVLRDSVDRAIAIWLERITNTLDSDLRPVAANAVGDAAARALNRLTTTIDSTGALGQAVVALGDRVVRQAIQAIREETERGVPWWVWLIFALVAAAIVSIIGRFIIAILRERDRGKTTLRLVAQVIKERKDPTLTEAVKQLTRPQGVEPWFRAFLADEHLLVQSDSTNG